MTIPIKNLPKRGIEPILQELKCEYDKLHTENTLLKKRVFELPEDKRLEMPENADISKLINMMGYATFREVQREMYILRLLSTATLQETAESLGIGERTLYRNIKELGLREEERLKEVWQQNV